MPVHRPTSLPEPWRVKVVEPIHLASPEERETHLRAAHFNLFGLPGEAVFIDLLTDSGTSALSQNQWAGLVTGDESYAGARSFTRFEAVVQEIFGLEHVLPVHQGRAGERLVFQEIVESGMVVPSNHHFDTTRANVMLAGGEPVDLTVAAARRPDDPEAFKGNMDLAALDGVLSEHGRDKVPLVLMTITNNSVGGQPVSLANLRATSEICRRHDVPLWIDACRFAENAWFVREREPGQRTRSLRGIVRETFALADGVLMSGKKDGLSNIGGFVALRDDSLAQRLRERMVVTEGFPTYGGLAGRDLESLAVGLEEVLDEDYLRYRVSQVAAFGDALEEAGARIVRPVGGHAVYLDAGAMLPHLAPEEYPGQALAVALYRHGGVRGVEVGTVMFGDVDAQGRGIPAALDLVRLAVPRRVYTHAHLRYVADVVREALARPEAVRGLRMSHVPPVLRHFSAQFEELAEPLPEAVAPVLAFGGGVN